MTIEKYLNGLKELEAKGSPKPWIDRNDYVGANNGFVVAEFDHTDNKFNNTAIVVSAVNSLKTLIELVELYRAAVCIRNCESADRCAEQIIKKGEKK